MWSLQMTELWPTASEKATGQSSTLVIIFLALNTEHSPVALCPSQSSYVYAAMVLHALFFVPQVKEYVASFRPVAGTPDALTTPASVVSPPTSGPGT